MSRRRSDFAKLYEAAILFIAIGVVSLVFSFFKDNKEKIQSSGYIIGIAAIVLLALFAVVFVLLKKKNKKAALVLNSEEDILYMLRGMPWNKFEKKVAEIFSGLGYLDVRVVGQTGDHGKDVEMKKDGKEYFVQCKHYLDKTIGEPSIRDFYGAITGGYAEKGFFITTSDFTRQAKKFAEEHPRLELVDGKKLVEFYRAAQGGVK